ASYTAGRGDESRTVSPELADEVKRWEAGIAADHTFPLRSMLVGAELVARRPIDAADVEWIAASGVRYQVGPRLSLDAGIGRSLARDGEWFVTFGSAVSFALIHRVGGVR
ncbi:MAG: hypothetical protein ABIT38_13385, partial [Gemmatimonadaceae bacterium]